MGSVNHDGIELRRNDDSSIEKSSEDTARKVGYTLPGSCVGDRRKAGTLPEALNSC